MFGYVQPLKPELKVKENEAYQGYYCGLCKAIKQNYTNAARFMLNYDCATLLLLFSSMSDEAPQVRRETCVVSPLKKKTIVSSGAAPYAAAVNVLLGCAKIADTAADERSITAKLLLLFYRGVQRRAAKDYGELADAFAQRITALSALERQGCTEIDAVSAEFGQLLASAFSLAPYEYLDEAARKALWHFGYNLGRWIYIADAADDLEKDAKGKSYNVFLARPHGDIASIRQEILEDAQFNLHYSLAEACKAYELLDIRRDKPLLDNIMYLGLAKKTEEVLKGKANGSV
ncbi:MAG: DUF5685 family protein [Bacillota bacterium]